MTVRDRRPARPRPQLDRESILDAGIRLAASGRADAVSVRRLGAELGADPTAIYRHFRDKDELVLALLDRLLAQVDATADSSGDWRARLRSYALVTVQVMCDHPCIGVEAGTRSTSGPAELRAIEHVLTAFTEAGLDDDAAVRFYGVYTGYVLAFASALAAGRLNDPGTGGPDDHWVEPLGRVDPATHPHVARQAESLMRLTTDDVITTGIDVVLDAAEAAARP